MVTLALLWHMHQPYYQDLATGEHILPWVRLHAIKDYWGMVALLEEFPAIRVTFNLVPSLVAQVEEFAADRARDRHLELGLKPAADLDEREAQWMVANGFHAPYGRMIAPFPRYAELHAIRQARRSFAEADLRDLQVWHKLVWMDPDRLATDKRLVAMIEKDRHFTEEDKASLRAIELELLRCVVPAYREASRRGQVELSTSPYYHPILPLLVDSDIHLVAHPHADRPRTRFARPDDARTQIERAVTFHESRFGSRPRGMWPSEGSVSDQAVASIAAAGLEWIATDEDILAKSLGVALSRDGSGQAERPGVLYRPYRLSAGPVAFFRDHALSDRIGFQYQSWEAAAAASDFIGRVREAGRRFSEATGGAVGTVAVILDGENAWEHYAGGGRPFLRALYAGLSAASDVRTVTFSEAAGMSQARALPKLFPGSWINADFYIWIGHRDDHRAWSQLADARAEFDRRASSVEVTARDRAFEELLIAEGSDWFWWYGDDHSSDHDREFDDLFRRHLRNAYSALGSDIPDELYASNISTGSAPERLMPAGDPAVTLDGRDTSFLEWMGAARAPLSKPAGSMHEVAPPSAVTDVLVGATPSSLCIRLAGAGATGKLAVSQVTLAIVVSAPAVRHVPIEGRWIRVGSVAEIEVPFAALGVKAGDELRFGLQLLDASGSVLESVPFDRSWSLQIPVSATGVWRV